MAASRRPFREPDVARAEFRVEVVLASAGAIACAGCVLPVAPEFHAEKNESPFLVEVRPPVGSIITDQRATFSVTVADPNRTDTLYARWLIDYPPYNPAISRSHESILGVDDLEPENRHSINFKPECLDHGISRALVRHQLVLVVADRPFIDSEELTGGTRLLDQTASDANKVQLFWTFDKDCNPL
jgi:hypothetical protein